MKLGILHICMHIKKRPKQDIEGNRGGKPNEHTHTHTHIYIYIYIYVCVSMMEMRKDRENERNNT